MEQIIKEYLGEFELFILFGVNLLLIIILFIINISTRSKLKKITKKYNSFMNGVDNKNMEQLLETSIEKSNIVTVKNKEIENRINYLERNVLQCIQKVGIVRYNAFDNVGSDLSFAIALLDGNDNGVVVNGIYTRESSSTYAKAVSAGKSKYPLSAEEVQAIDIAKKETNL